MTSVRLRSIQDEYRVLESRLHKLESELSSSELSRDALRQDKETVNIVEHYINISNFNIKHFLLAINLCGTVRPCSKFG